MTTIDVAQRYPVRLIESGPAGGTVLAADIGAGLRHRARDVVRHGRDHGEDLLHRRLASRSMRGHSRRPACTVSPKARACRCAFPSSRWWRSAPAAARSRASTRSSGSRSGPRAPAPSPAPACYGRGGTKPTVTDADLVAGRIDPARFAGGSISPRRRGARAALGARDRERRCLDAGRRGLGRRRSRRGEHGQCRAGPCDRRRARAGRLYRDRLRRRCTACMRPRSPRSSA